MAEKESLHSLSVLTITNLIQTYPEGVRGAATRNHKHGRAGGAGHHHLLHVQRGRGPRQHDNGGGHLAHDLLRHAHHALPLHIAGPLARAHCQEQDLRQSEWTSLYFFYT